MIDWTKYEEVSEDSLDPADKFLCKFLYSREDEDIAIQAMDSLDNTPEWKTYQFIRELNEQTDEYKALIAFNPGAKIARSLPLSFLLVGENEPDLSEEEINLYWAYIGTPERQVLMKAWKAYWPLLEDRLRVMDMKERAKQLNLRCV